MGNTLKPNASNNKARRIKFHRYVRQFLPRDHGGFGHKNQKMSWLFRHCAKSQTFSNSCAQNCHDLLAKIGEHIDGTSGAERGCNTDWTLVPIVCFSWLVYGDFGQSKKLLPDGLNPILPMWNFISFAYFTIPSSSRHEKCCQMLERLFVVFDHSRNTPFGWKDSNVPLLMIS